MLISTTITKISVIAHSLFLTNSYQVYSCGYNNNGQLGIGGTTTQYNPVLITYFVDNNINIKDIAAGSHHLLFLTNSEICL